MFTKYRGEFYLILGALFFSFNGVVSTVVLQHISPYRLVEVRCIGAFVLLFLITLVTNPASLKATRSEIPVLLMFGMIGFAVVQIGFFVGIQRGVPLSLVLIIEFTSPIWIVLWIKYVRKLAVPGSMWSAIALSLVGLTLVAKLWEGLTLDPIGILGPVASAFALSIYFLVGEKVGATRSAQSIAVWGFGVAGAVLAIAMPVWTFPFSIFTTPMNLDGSLSSFTAPGWALILWVLVPGTIVPYLFVLGGIRRLSASTSSVMGMLEPIFAGIFAWTWLGQSWSAIQLIGGAVVLVGIYIADRARVASV